MDVGAGEIGRTLIGRVVEAGGGDLELLVVCPPRRPTARIQVASRDAVHIIFGDDELRIEIGIAGEDRFLEPQDSGRIVDLVIYIAGEQAGLDDAVRAQPVANLRPKQRQKGAASENFLTALPAAAMQACARFCSRPITRPMA